MTAASPAPDPQRFRQVLALFERAVMLPPSEREAFVRREAGGDEALCVRVLALLRADGDANVLASQPAMDPATGRSPTFERLHALLERALDVPESEREAFVRRAAAADPVLRDRAIAVSQTILELLRGATQAEHDGDSAHGAAGDRVQSTATGELLEKLATAPKLDTERFALEGEIAQGGMGAIVRIHDRFLNRRLAMKVLLERAAPRDADEQRIAHQLLGRFLEEAQVTSQLDHPGVVPVHELGLDQNGKVYFTMRLVKGRTASEVFADAFAEQHDWNLTRALEVILKVCDAMAYAHDKGVLHRDLKPSNVMVGRFGEVYVMDWGLAKVLGQPDRHDLRIKQDASTGVSRIDSARKHDADTDTASSIVTMDGHVLGTPSYMSPEQAKSEELDARADVYAIGAMLYELVTGRAPYTLPGVHASPYRILGEVIDSPPKRIEQIQKGVPAELVAIVDKAMARGRDERYRSVLELAADVRAFLAQRVVKAYRTGALVEMRLWVRRNRALAASLGAAAVILVAGIVLASWLANKNAVLAQDESTARQRFEGKVQEFDQLKLVVTYERMVKEEATLGPGWPEQRAAIGGWIADAQRLLGLREDLAATVAGLRHDAEEQGAGGAESAATFLANSLSDLLERLPQLEALLPEMQKRHRWAQQVASLTRAHPKAKVSWAEARAAIAKADGEVASALYAGQDIPLRDEDVWGLVPIGRNPQSKLWEFYDMRSAWDGEADPATLPIPEYGADGRLTITGETGIVLVLLPGGTLPPGTPVDANDEGAKRRLMVRLDPFFLGKYELTQGQWLRWTGENPSRLKNRNDLSLPVEQLSWFDSDPVLRAQGLVLPSELQWEYAIRAGTTTLWWTGDDEAGIKSAENVGETSVLPVGSKSPNPFGLFDMSGNVWEWCWDWLGSYGTERAGDGRRPKPTDGSVSHVVWRGGIFGWDYGLAQSALRDGNSPSLRLGALGLRPARTSRR